MLSYNPVPRRSTAPLMRPFKYVRVVEYEVQSGHVFSRRCDFSDECVRKIEAAKGDVADWASPFGEPEVWVEANTKPDFSGERFILVRFRHTGTGWKKVAGGGFTWDLYWQAHPEGW